MSALYRKFFIQGLNQAFLDGHITWQDYEWDNLIHSLKQSSFNVFTKKPFAGPLRVIQYIGRYSHRVAITNHRILYLDNNQVKFSYKDYRDGQSKIMTLTPSEFARRFLMHVLPKGFAKIRHYGILSNKAKSTNIPAILHFFERRIPSKSKFCPKEYFLKKFNIDLSRCPKCKTGILKRSAVIPQSRGDPDITSIHAQTGNSLNQTL
jgi:hypothetical protein